MASCLALGNAVTQLNETFAKQNFHCAPFTCHVSMCLQYACKHMFDSYTAGNWQLTLETPFITDKKTLCQDLLASLGRLRPPYRWLLIGPKRSGSTLHKDPLDEETPWRTKYSTGSTKIYCRWEVNIQAGFKRWWQEGHINCFVFRVSRDSFWNIFFCFSFIWFFIPLFVSTNSFLRSHGLKHGKAFTDLWQDPLGTSAWNALISGRTLDMVDLVGMRYPRYQLT